MVGQETSGPQTLLGTRVLSTWVMQLYSTKPDKKGAANSVTTVTPWHLLASVCSLDVGIWEKPSDTFSGTRVLRQRTEENEAGARNVKVQCVQNECLQVFP